MFPCAKHCLLFHSSLRGIRAGTIVLTSLEWREPTFGEGEVHLLRSTSWRPAEAASQWYSPTCAAFGGELGALGGGPQVPLPIPQTGRASALVGRVHLWRRKDFFLLLLFMLQMTHPSLASQLQTLRSSCGGAPFEDPHVKAQVCTSSSST